MFKDRAFNLSLLFSSAWHLLWICLIGIIITPSVQPSNFYQEVDFLGPILEKTAFDLMVEEATPQAETLYARTTFFQEKVYLKPSGPKRKVLKEFIPGTLREDFVVSLQDYLRDKKEVSRYSVGDISTFYREKKDDAPLTVIEGSAGKREVIFKPKLTKVPRGLYGNAEKYFVKLRFFISNDGIVYDVEPLASSGYTRIDLQAVRFLRRWRFSPLSLAEKDKSTWGIVTVKVEAR